MTRPAFLSRTLPYPLRRLLQVAPVMLVIVVLNFFLLRLAPGDMADAMAGEAGASTPEYVAQLRAQFGADRPVSTQFGHYVSRLARLDLGWSYRNGESVTQLILERLPATALLMVTSLSVALLVGCALGVAAALTRWRAVDTLISTVATIGFATPLFWLGLMLIVLFSVKLEWLPSSGLRKLGASLSGWSAIVDVIRHLVLPALCLSVYYIALFARLMRSAVSEVARQDFVRTARAKGVSTSGTITHHIVPNAMLSILTMTALQFGTLFSGSVAIETVFGWPGLGQLALNAVMARDLNLLMGILFMSSLFVLFVNLCTDLLYARIDPRVELQ